MKFITSFAIIGVFIATYCVSVLLFGDVNWENPLEDRYLLISFLYIVFIGAPSFLISGAYYLHHHRRHFFGKNLTLKKQMILGGYILIGFVYFLGIFAYFFNYGLDIFNMKF